MKEQEPEQSGLPRKFSTRNQDSGYEPGSTRDIDAPAEPESQELDQSSSQSIPEMLGRYHVIHEIGSGGFGTVYQAYDTRLKRNVAVKVPNSIILSNQAAWNSFIDEGRTLARLSHPGIVAVHDVDKDENELPFVVMEYVSGISLDKYVRQFELDLIAKLQLVLRVAEGLHYVHQNDIVHCDLKPSNILVTHAGVPRITDFGLALRADDTIKKLSTTAVGTLNFMSPEQIRGENHRLEARTDIWSLGVTIYWLFTNRLPFDRPDSKSTSDAVCKEEPQPLLELVPDLPERLEHICSRCMRKRVTERFSNVGEIGIELRHLLSQLNSESGVSDTVGTAARVDTTPFSNKTADLKPRRTAEHLVDVSESELKDQLGAKIATLSEDDIESRRSRIAAKGLRAFDEHDATFFLQLLPEPKDHLGVPESVRFWVNWVCQKKDPDAFGVINGPTGSGKSSFVRAGLLPFLPPHVDFIFVDAGRIDLDAEFSHLLRRRLMINDSDDESLMDLMNGLRRANRLNGNEKTLIVVDQFEQWLDKNSLESLPPLIEALRQCDGENVQCLFLVRDDFWLSVQQLFGMLDSSIRDGENSLPLPLFDENHAMQVLIGLGQAHGCIDHELQKSQLEFVQRAVWKLKINGRIIPAHLTLFIEMMKVREWDVSQIQSVGDWQNLGVQFLNDQFGNIGKNRRLASAVKSILANLLPESASMIKSPGKTKQELKQIATEHVKEEEFSTAIDLLDRELKLITRHDSVNWNADESSRTTYKLSHDILIGPIKNWLRDKQNESWKGRAYSRLTDLTETWTQDSEDRFLPSLSEYARITLAVPQKAMVPPQRVLMNRASKYYLIRAAVLLFVVTVIAGFVLNAVERSRRHLTAKILDNLSTAKAPALPGLFGELKGLKHTALPMINKVVEFKSPQQKLRLLIAESFLLDAANVPIEELIDEILRCKPEELVLLIDELNKAQSLDAETRAKVISGLESHYDELAKQYSGKELYVGQAKFAAAMFQLGQPQQLRDLLEYSSDPTARTIAIHSLMSYLTDLNQVLDWMDVEQKPSVITGVLTALALEFDSPIPAAQFVGIDQRRLLSKVDQMFGDSKTPHAVIAACKRLYLDMGREIPELDIGEGIDSIRLRIDGQPFSLVLIKRDSIDILNSTRPEYLTRSLLPEMSEPLPPSPRTISVDQEFYIGETEIPASLINTYFAEVGFKFGNSNLLRNTALDSDQPACFVNQYSAMNFCNWLSLRMGLEPYYVLDESINYMDVNQLLKAKPIIRIDDANGFRLPTLTQAEFALRGGAVTGFPFGTLDQMGVLANYAVFAKNNMNESTESIYARIPNRFGLFGTIGNVSEWTDNFWHSTHSHGLVVGSSVGNGYDVWAGFCESIPSELEFLSTGIRVTLPIVGAKKIMRERVSHVSSDD